MKGNRSACSVSILSNGGLSLKCGGMFASMAEVEKFLADACGQFKEAFKWQQERGAIPAMA